MTAKDLKNALLQEAVQGKLVPQIASEGNARDLLEEIRKEKLSHGLDFANAKSGKRKSKKETALAGSNPCDIKEDEIPFDIPESWCWCRLGEICQNVNYGTSAKSQSTGIVPVLRMGNITKDGKLSFDNLVYTSDKTEIETYKLNSGDILFNRTNSAEWVGKTTVYKGERPAIFAGYIIRYTPIIVDSDYVNIVMNTSYQKKWCSEVKTNGVQQCNINAQNLMKFIFPLPPLAEQKRIVAAIEKFMPIIEEYGKKETELKAINEKIGTLTKKAILQEAVQGKLVPQIAAEGNAKKLLEEIKKEKAKLIKEGKIKKEKPLPEISDDEIPFDIPESWCWCKVEDITIPIGNKNNQIQSKEVLKDGKIPVVSQGQNLIDGYSNETEKAIKDIPVIMFGDHTRNVKYIDFPFIIGADGTKFFKPILCNKYYIYYLITFISLKLRNRGYARHYSLLKEEWLPLPPLVEQKRIVDAIEKLLPLCEKLGEK